MKRSLQPEVKPIKTRNESGMSMPSADNLNQRSKIDKTCVKVPTKIEAVMKL